MAEPESNRIDDWTIQTYLGELVNQAEAAELAVADFNAALAGGARGVARAFASVQALLGAAALISKLLWPQPPSRNANGDSLTSDEETQRAFTIARARRLRELTAIKGLPILESRKVRNGLEHFDERLDKFFLSGQSIVADRNIGPKDRLVIIGDAPAMHLRLIDNERLTASVLGDEVSLQGLMNATQLVGMKASAAIEVLRRSY
ncbi:hypothetical protein [Leifsonia sp. A12D58]|uniref:hypothetical protein n=1 Tax=Leifsonia sp. A12D58 TaxID=3397674 RepID=UPI0039E1917A